MNDYEGKPLFNWIYSQSGLFRDYNLSNMKTKLKYKQYKNKFVLLFIGLNVYCCKVYTYLIKYKLIKYS